MVSYSLVHLAKNTVTLYLFIIILELFIETDAIDYSKPANEEYLAKINSTSINFELDIELRNCEIGE